MIEMQNGDIIRFRTTGYEIADVRNPNPDPEWTGVMAGGPNDTHVVLWCERERRQRDARHQCGWNAAPSPAIATSTAALNLGAAALLSE